MALPPDDDDNLDRLRELRDKHRNGIPAVRDFLSGYPQIYKDDLGGFAISSIGNHVHVIETIDKHYTRKI